MKLLRLFPLVIFLLGSCAKNSDKVFKAGEIGGLHGGMTVEQVKNVLSSDSLNAPKKVTGIVEQQVTEVVDRKTGEKKWLLIFEPQGDTLKLYAVEILSPEYVSEKGAGLETPYAEWKKKHKITRAERTLRHVVVFVDDLNAILEFNNDDLVETARHKTGNPDPDWIKPDAKPSRIVLFMKK